MRRFKPVYFIDDEAQDLEEAIRIALRKARLDPDTFRYRRKWHFHAPDEWRAKAEAAPPALVKKVRDDLDWIDATRREDERRCEAMIALLLDAMRSDVWVAAVLIEYIEADYDEDSIPGVAVARFRKECGA